MTLGQPKLPSWPEQELHFVTHWPYAPWCQACVASRAKEDKRKASQIWAQLSSSWTSCTLTQVLKAAWRSQHRAESKKGKTNMAPV